MITVSPRAPKDKPHYTYTLSYPDDYPELDKAGAVFYVGKGTEARKGKDRIEDHERDARSGVKSYKCNVIRKIWNAGGQVIREKLAYFETHEEALQYEIALIFLMRGYGHLTNLTDGGDGIVGLVRSEEYRRKLSVATSTYMKLHNPNKGRKHPSETGRKISEALKGKSKPLSEKGRQRLAEYNKSRRGKPRPFSEEWRRNIAESNKQKKSGKPLSEEHRRKISEGLKGKSKQAFSEEHRRNLSEANKGKPGWNKGVPATEETKRKLRESHMGQRRPHTEETKRKISEALKGRLMHPVTDETRRKLSETSKGRVISEETRRKLSEANRGKLTGRVPANKGVSMSEEQKVKLRAAWVRRRARDYQTFSPEAYTQGLLFPPELIDSDQLSKDFDASTDVESP